MSSLLRYLHSDFLKIKRLPLLLIHIIIPFLGFTIFLVYYSCTTWTPMSKAAGFMQTLAVAFPLLISIVCSMSVEQDALAGNFQYLLTAPLKNAAFLSKLMVLIILGLGAVMIAMVGFGVGFITLQHLTPFHLNFYIRCAFLLLFSNLFLYVFHLLVDLRFGRGTSIGLGMIESLLSALLVTNLGDGRWQYIPCAWGSRLVTTYALYIKGSNNSLSIHSEMLSGLTFCFVGTFLIILLAFLWFNRFEGRKSME